MNRRQFLSFSGALSIAALTPAVLQAKPTIPSKVSTYTPDVVFATGLESANNHIYGSDAWENAVQRVAQRRILVQFVDEATSGLNLTHVCAVITDMQIIPDDKLIYRATARIRALKTSSGVKLELLAKSRTDMYLSPVGFGLVDRYHNVTNYELSYFSITTNPAFEHATPIVLSE